MRTSWKPPSERDKTCRRKNKTHGDERHARTSKRLLLLRPRRAVRRGRRRGQVRFHRRLGRTGRAGTNPERLRRDDRPAAGRRRLDARSPPRKRRCFFGPAGPFPWADRASARMSARAGAVGACQRGGVSGAGQAGERAERRPARPGAERRRRARLRRPGRAARPPRTRAARRRAGRARRGRRA